ncbi:hypothetical protein BCR35DRAFT_305874 [Leucosporidium creatinivorum]|uniref:Uncharacterized protein n=1 Tax=Leucosporidium creatinivorum TaxID=106004 RepID=A0A1Y2EYB7_9BASI|nr:hypothetical protein BCR35DRAFT_305874 [Leucosporidium creatinivorum]
MVRPHASSVDAEPAWGAPTTQEDDVTPELTAQDVLDKEALVKDIITKQDGLRALLQRVTDVQAEGAKLKSDNSTLQTYIDNLTRNNAAMAAPR